jgi:hypothetical protein
MLCNVKFVKTNPHINSVKLFEIYLLIKNKKMG